MLPVGSAMPSWRLRFALRLAGAVALVAAATVTLLQIRVGGPGSAGRSCGSSLDIIIDRTGWERWYAQDTVDAPSPPLLRTLRCPSAVNTRTAIAGALAAAGVVALFAAIYRQRGRTEARVGTSEEPSHLRRLGAIVTAAGTALTIAGLGALGALLANGRSTIFIFVGRPLVALIGLVVLAPVLALVAAGRAITLLADGLGRQAPDATA